MILLLQWFVNNSSREERQYSDVWYETIALNYSEDQFYKHFRFPKAAFEYILNEIEGGYRKRLDVRKALMATIWLLASGDSYRTVSQLFGIPKTTFAMAAHHVCQLICRSFPDCVSYNRPRGSSY